MHPPERWIEAYFDGELTAEEEQLFLEWLREDREHLQMFAREAHFHRIVSQTCISNAFFRHEPSPLLPKIEPPASDSSAWRPLIRRFQNYWWAPVFAIALILLLVWSPWQTGDAGVVRLIAGGDGVVLSRDGVEFLVRTPVTLRAGDTIRTPPAMLATVDYVYEGTRLELGGGSFLRLGQDDGLKQIHLETGVIHATVAKQSEGERLRLETPEALVEVLGTELRLATTHLMSTLEVYAGRTRLAQRTRPGNTVVESGQAATVGPGDSLVVSAAPQPTGQLSAAYWFQIADTLPDGDSPLPPFPQVPDQRTTLSQFEIPTNETQHYGARLTGWLYPPRTGDYRFWVVADDRGELWLSPNDQFETKRLLCRTSGYSLPGEWDKSPSQRSDVVRLIAGRRYYIEGVLRQAGGSALFEVAWEGPSLSRQPLSGRYLSPATTTTTSHGP